MAETLRGGRFVIVGVLGEGSQGRTFDATDQQTGEAVAIKRFDVRGARAWKDVDLAERETRVLRALSHPKLPRYVDHFEQDGALYLVTEKVPGASLSRLKAQGAPFGEREAMQLLADAADILAYLHGRAPPVVHRDIKPANVVRRPDGSFAFVDFGAVRDNLRPEGGSTVVGTFGYMAPEQFQGRALPGSDVYGVGATVLSLLAGAEPEALPHRGLAIDVRAAVKGKASERLVRILERMLDPDPDRRATSIAPLLSAKEARAGRGDARRRSEPWDGRAPWEGRGGSWDGSWQRSARWEARQARWAAREEAKVAREEAWAVRKQAKAWRRAHRGRGGFAWPLEAIFTLVFAVGLVVVSVVTQVAVPLLLRILSIFFARRPLVAAADAVQQAGGAAVRSISQSRRWMRGEAPEAGRAEPRSPPQRVAVDREAEQRENPGIRVSPGEPEEEAEDDEHERASRRGR